MTTVGELEAKTQRRVVEMFLNRLGYRYLGYWKDRSDNANIEPDFLKAWLAKQGHNDKVIDKALRELERAAAVTGSKSLYEANKEVYSLLRYGVKVSPDVGEQKITVHLIDWKNPRNNDFAVAEEVTIAGVNEKRPDVVVYVNGIALAVLELKRSIVSVSEGIRQNYDNQKREFVRPFFATVQFLLAGNDSQGMRYGVIEAAEKYYMEWKEQDPTWTPLDGKESKCLAPWAPKGGPHRLDTEICWLCAPERLLELIHDFIVFDAGIKKTARHNQYFGVKAAQARVRAREGGIIWHTQGSGKSLTMVWLAKWIRENVKDPRVLIITDRTELDEQIERVFKGVDENIHRANSGADLASVLNSHDEWLISSLVHKFGMAEEGDVEEYVRDIRKHLPKGFSPKGVIFVFVDECHRTQSGKLHDAMKALLPGAMLIGFTGTPLLSRDKQKSIEVFGPFIHTYKYDEAVRDKVVLDLRYEARNIDQNLTSPDKVDQWFDVKTQGLTEVARAQLKRRWGTMQKVLSAKSRLEQIVNDILLDMETRDRLSSGRGNAMLVAGSIYSACRFYQSFQDTDLADKCAIITSYRPSASEIKGEDAGEGLNEKLLQYNAYRRMLARHFNESEDSAAGKIELFEREVKQKFIKEPGQMKLLIVVDKLLTGFDAPPATYLYIDKQMQDHGLFQAICRVNRLDDEDKSYGYIIDYKDLFKTLEKSIKDYTGGAFDAFDEEDVAKLLVNRMDAGRERLDAAREAAKALCEPVEPPRDTRAYMRYFVSQDSTDGEEVENNESRRLTLYKLVSELLRAYADIANEMPQAGYTSAEAVAIRDEVDHFTKVSQEVKLASGDYIDLKKYEPSMRHLLDTYIRAEETRSVSGLNDMTLVELLVEYGAGAVDSLPEGIRSNQEAVAETIENNVRKVCIDQAPVNPKYYEKMSELLDALIQERKKAAIEYEEYLEQIAELATRASRPETASGKYPRSLTTAPLRALYDDLGEDEPLTLRLDKAIQAVKQADWRGNRFKERQIRNAIRETCGGEEQAVDALMEIVKNQRDY